MNFVSENINTLAFLKKLQFRKKCTRKRKGIGNLTKANSSGITNSLLNPLHESNF